VPGDEFAMPSGESFSGVTNPGQLVEHLPCEDLAFYRESPPLVVVEQNPFLSELLPEYPVFGTKVSDGILLPTVLPSGKTEAAAARAATRSSQFLRICGESPQHPGS